MPAVLNEQRKQAASNFPFIGTMKNDTKAKPPKHRLRDTCRAISWSTAIEQGLGVCNYSPKPNPPCTLLERTNWLEYLSHLVKWQVSSDGCQNNDFILFSKFFFLERRERETLSTFSHLTSHFENPSKENERAKINSSQYKGGCSKWNQNLEAQMPTAVSILPVSIHTHMVPIKWWPHSKGMVKRIFLWTV